MYTAHNLECQKRMGEERIAQGAVRKFPRHAAERCAEQRSVAVAFADGKAQPVAELQGEIVTAGDIDEGRDEKRLLAAMPHNLPLDFLNRNDIGVTVAERVAHFIDRCRETSVRRMAEIDR
jgi:hypothetical protein